MDKVIVKPAEGRSCYTPSGVKLSPDGERVTFSSYWRRRVADGSAVIVKPEAKPAAEQPEAEAEPEHPEQPEAPAVEQPEAPAVEPKPKRSRKSKTGDAAGEE